MVQFLVTGSPIDARKSAPVFLWILILCFIIGIIVLLYFIIKHITKYYHSSDFMAKDKNRPCRKSDVTKLSKQFNLTHSQIDLLWIICKETNSLNVRYIARTNMGINQLFFAGYKSLQQKKIFTPQLQDAFFTLLYKMEMTLVQNKKIPTTHSLPISTIIFYISEENEQFPLVIEKNEKDFFSVEIPIFLFKSNKKPNILDKCQFIYKTNDGLSYSFNSRVIRFEEINDEKVLMVIGHTDQLTSQPQRQCKREFVEERCNFSPVRINQNKEQNKSKYIYSNKFYEGKIINISVGGCCIQTNLPIKENQYLSVTIPGYNINEKIIGNIKKTRRLPSGDFALHIQFTHISLETKNIIHAIVYKFEL